MKLKIDTKNKEIVIKEDAELKELTDCLRLLFPTREDRTKYLFKVVKDFKEWKEEKVIDSLKVDKKEPYWWKDSDISNYYLKVK